MSNSDNPKEIIGRECVFVTHLEAMQDVREDTHIVKEILHYKDGTYERKLRLIKNFKRPFWITKQHYQNHQQKKESEELERLNEYTATQSNLGREVATRLGGRYIGKTTLRDVSASPYVYGIDVDSKTMIKHQYQTKYPGFTTPYTVAALDIETNVDTDEIMIISLTMYDKIHTVILKKALDNLKDIESRLEYLFKKYVPETDMTKNITVKYEICDTELDLVTKIIAKAHEWQPDFVAIWNITFDMNHMLNVCKKFGADPATIFSDPKLPKEFRHFKFKPGSTSKLTESGKYTPINIEQQWHVVTASSSFYWIDAMSAHRYVRVGGKSVPGGYSLDNILKFELGSNFQKLKFPSEDTAHIKGVDWHKYMLKNKTLEYIIYNQWDVMSMIELDRKTKDLEANIGTLSVMSSFDIFNSGPKRIVDSLHFFYLENGRVLGCKTKTVDSDKVLGLDNWIAILPSYAIRDHGIDMFQESGLSTNIRGLTYDAD